jgi:carbon-monoxide dehydrogenase large subunit
VQVAVNPATGEVRVERVAAAIDMGQPINPTMCRQQIQGAIAQGIGMSIYEELLFEEGRVCNASLMNYKIPLTVDIPQGDDLRIALCPSPEQHGPFGAKGLGEIALTPFYAAVGNAFFAATGVRIATLPLSKERVYAALCAAAGQPLDATGSARR